MNIHHYIGFDVHKKTISYCVKTADGTIVEEANCEPLARRSERGRKSVWNRGRERWKRLCSAGGFTTP
jgi:transposase